MFHGGGKKDKAPGPTVRHLVSNNRMYSIVQTHPHKLMCLYSMCESKHKHVLQSKIAPNLIQ